MRNVALARASRSFPAANVDVGVLAFSALMLPRNVLFTIYHSRTTKKPAADAQSALNGKKPDQKYQACNNENRKIGNADKSTAKDVF